MSAGGHQGHLPDSPQQKLPSKVIIRFLCILLLEMTSPGWNPCVPPIFTCRLRSPHLCPYSNYSLTTGIYQLVTKRLQTLLPERLAPQSTV